MNHDSARRASLAFLTIGLMSAPLAAQELPPLPELPALPDGASTNTRTAPGQVSDKQSVTDHAAQTTAMPSVPQVETPAVAPMPASNLAVGTVGGGSGKSADLPALPPLPAPASAFNAPAASGSSATATSAAPTPTTVTTVASPNLPAVPDVGAAEVDQWMRGGTKTADPTPTNNADPKGVSASVLPNAGLPAASAAKSSGNAPAAPAAKGANASIFSNIDLPTAPQPGGNGVSGTRASATANATANAGSNLPPLPLPDTGSASSAALLEVPATIPDTASAKGSSPKAGTQADLPAKPKKSKKTAARNTSPKPPFYAFQYKSQFLPEAIYKPVYTSQNKHLPKAQTEADYDRFLFQAAAQNNAAGLRALLNTQGRSTEILDPTGETPLIVAVRYGAGNAARILLSSGANPDARDAAGVSALHYAVLTRNPDLVRVLLQAHANAQARDPWGQTPLDLAHYVRDGAMVQLLQDPQYMAGGGGIPRS